MNTLRIMSFIGVMLTALFLPLWFFAFVACLYALFYSPIEILILSVCIDSQFGDVNNGMWYLYTLLGTGILIVTISLKPHIRFYE